jgi:uncharacterized protein (DUF302 family)
MDYKIDKKVTYSFDEAVEKVREALASEGFGILTEIDVQQTLKKKLNVESPRYLILGACNPPLAHSAIEAEPGIGVLLPCNVVIREMSNGHVIIEFMNPISVLDLLDNEKVNEIAKDVKSRIDNIISRL